MHTCRAEHRSGLGTPALHFEELHLILKLQLRGLHSELPGSNCSGSSMDHPWHQNDLGQGDGAVGSGHMCHPFCTRRIQNAWLP